MAARVREPPWGQLGGDMGSKSRAPFSFATPAQPDTRTQRNTAQHSTAHIFSQKSQQHATVSQTTARSGGACVVAKEIPIPHPPCWGIKKRSGGPEGRGGGGWGARGGRLVSSGRFAWAWSALCMGVWGVTLSGTRTLAAVPVPVVTSARLPFRTSGVLNGNRILRRDCSISRLSGCVRYAWVLCRLL
jgi:hypothetical protein